VSLYVIFPRHVPLRENNNMKTEIKITKPTKGLFNAPAGVSHEDHIFKSPNHVTLVYSEQAVKDGFGVRSALADNGKLVRFNYTPENSIFNDQRNSIMSFEDFMAKYSDATIRTRVLELREVMDAANQPVNIDKWYKWKFDPDDPAVYGWDALPFNKD
jgi:hypothetical protein